MLLLYRGSQWETNLFLSLIDSFGSAAKSKCIGNYFPEVVVAQKNDAIVRITESVRDEIGDFSCCITGTGD